MIETNCAETGPHFRQGHVAHASYKDLLPCCRGIWGIYLTGLGRKISRECRLIALQDPSIPFSDNFSETIEDFINSDGRIANYAIYRSRFLILEEWQRVWDVSAVLQTLFFGLGSINRQGGRLWIWLDHRITLSITPRHWLV